jgi:alkylated DNA nucleotide flippase Atl1
MCGGIDRHARTLNQRFIRDRIVGAHRVLNDDGTVSAGALRTPRDVRSRLESEGLAFSSDSADPAARLYPRDLPDLPLPSSGCDDGW